MTVVSVGSPLTALYQCLSQEQAAGLSLGEDGIEENRREQDKALADQLQAIQREADNQRNAGGGFFDSLAKVVTDVVHDLAHGNVTGAFKDAGDDLGAAWNSPHLWSDLQSGFEAVSVVAAAVSQAAQQIGGAAGTVVAGVASSIDQGADLVADLAGAREGSFAAAAKAAEADALSSKGELARLGADVTTLIADAKGDAQSLGRALDDVATSILDGGHALAASVASKGTP